MFARSLKVWLSPAASDGGGGGGGGGSSGGADATESDADGTGTETESEAGETEDEESDDKEGDEPPPKQKAPKKGAPRKVQVPSTRLKELESKAAKLDRIEQEQREAADKAETAKIQKQEEENPSAALTTLRRKYTNDTKKLQQQVDTLTQENSTLKREKAGDELVKGAKSILVAALKAAKLEPVNDKAADRMVKEFSAALDVERGEDGKYEIFGKEDGAEAADIAKKFISDEWKDLYLKPRRSDPANPGNSRRQEPETPKKPGWREGYAERQKAYSEANGVIPSVGLRPKSSS